MELKWFEDVEIGTVTELGPYTFTEEDIIAFATKFDPQPCHCDPVAASKGPYGRVIASGWHITSVWMQLMIAQRSPPPTDPSAGPQPRGGGSPGFLDLQWFEPVFPGDTLTYRTISVDKIELRSRPDWGIVRNQNEAVNQKGQQIFRSMGQGLISRKPK